MKNCFSIGLKLILLVFFSNLVTAQSYDQKNDLYEAFDNTVGEEVSGLYNGIQYKNEYIVLGEKHQFFNVDKFVKGYIQYDSQNYYDVSFKYDLLNDDIIVSPENASGSLTFRLIKSKVSRFSLNERIFINTTKDSLKSTEDVGFCEVLVCTDIICLYKKHIKKGSEKSKNGKIFFEFDTNILTISAMVMISYQWILEMN